MLASEPSIAKPSEALASGNHYQQPMALGKLVWQQSENIWKQETLLGKKKTNQNVA